MTGTVTLFMIFDFIQNVMGDKEEADKEIMINNSNMDDYELAIYIKKKNQQENGRVI